MCQNGKQHHAPPDDPHTYPVTFVFYCMFVILMYFNLFLVLINFGIVHVFLSLDVRLTLVLLTIFV